MSSRSRAAGRFKDGKAYVEVSNGKNLIVKKEIQTGLSDGVISKSGTD